MVGTIILTLNWRNWEIRQYKNGMWDAAQVHGSAITPGFHTFGDVMDYLLDTRS